MQNPTQVNPELNYFIAEQRGVVIVTFVGHLVRDTIPRVEKCLSELMALEFEWVILHFRDVPHHGDRSILPVLTKLQMQLRSRPARLRIASMHPDLRKFLSNQGVLRGDEVVDNLAQALQSLGGARAA